ncbi:DUF4843 domain-containing protein [Pinibacter aurantiacus]|uniref:DUF4843 domain-containing protein n=1 Tax=Pinibacter aurantiacus TaxID=2851599 RepID=A0A9E2S8E8_9BACT|nr:DUF4843 domain-containing protein [Pinibacter aurantiacus]MBV4358206.1 DUF4843 domain-containing protein [Pinibacter aurantiacus]
MHQSKFLIFIISCFLFSCTKEHTYPFPEERNAINIWLGSGTVVEDSFTHNFAYTITGRDSVMFNYRLSGFPLKHDTQFELQAVSGDTNRVYYTFGKYTIKARQYEGRFPIYIDKPAGYTEFTNSTGKIVFKLKESTDFLEGAEELSDLTVIFKNAVSKPDNWDVATSPYFTMSKYFGTYSNVKYAFIIQTTGMANFKIYYTVAKDPVLADNTITATQAAYFQNLCKAALLAYKNKYGPLMDENNSEVVFP